MSAPVNGHKATASHLATLEQITPTATTPATPNHATPTVDDATAPIPNAIYLVYPLKSYGGSSEEQRNRPADLIDGCTAHADYDGALQHAMEIANKRRRVRSGPEWQGGLRDDEAAEWMQSLGVYVFGKIVRT